MWYDAAQLLCGVAVAVVYAHSTQLRNENSHKGSGVASVGHKGLHNRSIDILKSE